MSIVTNKIGGSEAVIRLTASGNVALADLATSNNETVDQLYIHELFWTSNGYWTIARSDGNTVTTILELHGTGNFDFAGSGVSLNENPTEDLVITLSGGGSLVAVVKKKSTFASSY